MFSLVIAFLFGFVAVSFMVLSFWMIEVPLIKLTRTEFIDSCGVLIEEIDIRKNYYCRYYYQVVLFRGLLYSLILVGFASNPIVQLVLIEVLLNFPMLFYQVKYKPFEQQWNNALSIYCEFVISIAYMVIFLFNAIIPAIYRNYFDAFGWLLISLILLAMAGMLILTLPQTFSELYRLFARICTSADPNEATTAVLANSKTMPINMTTTPQIEESGATAKNITLCKECKNTGENTSNIVDCSIVEPQVTPSKENIAESNQCIAKSNANIKEGKKKLIFL